MYYICCGVRDFRFSCTFSFCLLYNLDSVVINTFCTATIVFVLILFSCMIFSINFVVLFLTIVSIWYLTFQRNLAEHSTGQESFESITVTSWKPWQVAQWLIGIKLAVYANEFMRQGIDGNQLITLDSSKIKVNI